MNKKKTILIIITVIILLTLIILGFFCFNKKEDKKSTVIKQEDVIKEYNYSIKATDSKLKKEKFKELKEILSENEIDYKEYAKKLAELFAIDVYDLNSKVNKYDVGGLEYILPEKKDSLKLVLQESLYNNIQDNIDKDRKQTLPVVKSADANKTIREEYQYGDKTYDAYVINVLIDYEKDLGYDKSVSIKIIEKDEKLFVVAINPD